MKRRLFFLLFSLLLLLPALSLAVPTDYTSRDKFSLGAFGTVSRLCVFDDFSDPQANLRFEALWEETRTVLTTLDALLSLSNPDSELSRFNQLGEGESMEVSPQTAAVFEKAMELYQLTEGYFNPAVYPLVDLWGFSPRFRNREGPDMPYDRVWDEENETLPPPDERYRQAFLTQCRFEDIRLTGSDESGWTLTKGIPSVTVEGRTYPARIDLGGIAKGYAADLVHEKMQELGIKWGFFSCGSSSMVLLSNANSEARAAQKPEFSLRVRSPRPGAEGPEAYACLQVRDACLSSSGDYDSNYLWNGMLCCHILDPFTGYPLNVVPGSVQEGLCTVTLLSGSACEDDALTTALLLMGRDRARKMLMGPLSDREAVLVQYRSGSDSYSVLTNLPEDRIRLEDPRFHLEPLF